MTEARTGLRALSGARVRATYRLWTGDGRSPEAAAHELCLEQTVEVVDELVRDPWIRQEIVGRVEQLDALPGPWHRLTVSYACEIIGDSLPQLLNVLYGNISLRHGIVLEALALPASFVAQFPGPRFGLAGLRQRLDAPTRPLLASALKPLGRSVKELAADCRALAEGGVDLIKDDHGLADQPFCPFVDRVEACVEAIAAAERVTGRRALYLPSLNERFDRLVERARWAARAGVGGLLLAPFLVGLDGLRVLAADPAVALPLMAHPGLTGAFFTHASVLSAAAGAAAAPSGQGPGAAHGIAPAVLLGTLMRLAGADLVVFPSAGGRFPFSTETCRTVSEALRGPLANLAPAWPVPAGGLTVERVPALLAEYGPDVVYLIGSSLLARDPDLRRSAAELRRLLTPGEGSRG